MSLKDTAKFCPSCGTDVEGERFDDAPKPDSGVEEQANSQVQPSVTPAGQGVRSREQQLVAASGNGLGMMFYTCLINFAFYCVAVLAVIIGILLITGLIYGPSVSPEFDAYAWFPTLKVTDTLSGFVWLALAALCVYCRNLMARFSAKAIKMYYVFAAVVPIPIVIRELGRAYCVAGFSSAEGTKKIITSLLLGAVTFAILYAIGKAYFTKREWLFVNP